MHACAYTPKNALETMVSIAVGRPCARQPQGLP
jgi:hypothetical protein